jgi:hypothetical protein
MGETQGAVAEPKEDRPVDGPLLVERVMSAVELGDDLPPDVAKDISVFIYGAGKPYALRAVKGLSKNAADCDENAVEPALDGYVAELVKPQGAISYESWQARENNLLPFLKGMKRAMKEGQQSRYVQ